MAGDVSIKGRNISAGTEVSVKLELNTFDHFGHAGFESFQEVGGFSAAFSSDLWCHVWRDSAALVME